VPVASGSVAADVSAPSGHRVGNRQLSWSWRWQYYLCSRGHGVATVAGESPHPKTSAATWARTRGLLESNCLKCDAVELRTTRANGAQSAISSLCD
jgi:hypothetical protein